MPALPPVGVRFVAPGAAAFNAAVGAANKAVSGFCGNAGQASNCLTALGQIVTGALREIGALAVRGFLAAGRAALQFASNLVEASLKGSELEATSKSLYAGLVEVTRVSLAPLTNQINELAKKAGPGFLGVVQAALTHLGGLGSRALVWGQNLVTQFANGIIAGAVAVINALADIANQVAYWLSPGSPPRLLPDIDRWGAGAMSAYLEGFTQADFGVFRELAGTVEGYLRSLSTGKDSGLIPAILGSREAIAAAIAQVRQSGQITTATLNGVFAALGPVSEAMREYVQATLELEQANQAVADLERGLENLNAAQQALLDEGTISQLELVAQDPNATAREKELARLEIEKLKMRGPLDAAKAEQAAAQDAFEIAKQKVLIETETNNLLKEQVGLLDSLIEKVAAVVDKLAKAATGAGGAGGIKAMLPDLDLLNKILEKLQPLIDAWERFKKAAQEAWDKLQEKMQPVYDFINDHVVPLLQKLWGILAAGATVAIGIFLSFWNNQLLPDLKTAWQWIQDNLVPIFAKLWTYFSALLPVALQITVMAFNGILLPALMGIYGIFSDLLVPILGLMLIHALILQPAAVKVWAAGIRDYLLAELVKLRDFIRDDLIPGVEKLTTIVTAQLALMGTEFDTKMAGILAAIAGPLTALGQLLQAAKDLWQWVRDNVIKFKIEVPSVVLPGSPTPFEMGIRGIKQAILEVNHMAISPRVSPPASAGQIYGRGGGNTTNNSSTIHYSPNYTTPARGAMQDYAIMQSLFGAAPG